MPASMRKRVDANAAKKKKAKKRQKEKKGAAGGSPSAWAISS